MKRKILFLFLAFLLSFKGFSQLRLTPKFSIGVMTGFTQNYEFMERYRNSYQINSKKNTTLRPRITLGFYAEYSNNKNFNLNIQLKLIRIIQHQYQDPNGNIAFDPALTVYETLNTSLYYDYYLKSHWTVSLGAYQNHKLFQGFNLPNLPTGLDVRSLHIYNNTYGLTAKTAYQWNRLGIEGGFMYPFKPVSRTESTWFYVPTAFLQLKYRMFKSKLLKEKGKTNNL
ncbi:MAG TPA: hypothetical protein VGE24_02600 [Emticicia sp.]